MSNAEGGSSLGVSPRALEVFHVLVQDVGRVSEEQLEAAVSEHPALEGDLRRLHADWKLAGDALRAVGGSLVHRQIQERFGKDADPEVTLDPESGDELELLARIGSRSEFEGRYRLEGQIAQGGMGTIQKVWDLDLRRKLARKVLRDDLVEERADKHQRLVARFLEEAQITAQLDHPGIVPVHELGIDPAGQLYFTMQLVKGEDLSAVFEKVAAGTDGWNRTRAVGVILNVCDAVAFAHSKGVVHRDIKPGNVMVGRFGETYVMDWGLARLLDREEIPVERPPTTSTGSLIHTEQHPPQEELRPDSPLITQDGEVVGTPSYMSPEQARGQLDQVGPASDVYSVGATLYHLLTGRIPYSQPGIVASPHAIWRWVLEGPPMPITRLVSDVPAELVAICEKAMARKSEDRYPDTLAMAADLRAYLEGRVVRAYRTGAAVELRKWITRNRGTAVVAAALLVVVFGASLALAWSERTRRKQTGRSLHERNAAALVAEADELYPIHPDRVAGMRGWLSEARALVAHLPPYAAELEAMRATPGTVETAAPSEELVERHRYTATWIGILERTYETGIPGADFLTPEEKAEHLALLDVELPRIRGELRALEREIDGMRAYTFADETEQERHDRLSRFVANLELLAAPGGRIEQIEERVRLAEGLAAATRAEHGPGTRSWNDAARAVAASPLYGGLRLAPVLGLVPLGPDPESGLWEFWHVLSGERPAGQPGEYALTRATGLVFVLVPGGRFQPAEPGPGFPLEIDLPAYLLSKYELTQGQWLRAAGSNPSENWPPSSFGNNPPIAWTNPVEHVTWEDAVDVLARWNLGLPTAAQWERAAWADQVGRPYAECRALLETDDVNCFDVAASSLRSHEGIVEPAPFDDDHSKHGRVDRFGADRFGFHALRGNVWEWVIDAYVPKADFLAGPPDPRTGELRPTFSDGTKACRGGGFLSPLSELRIHAVRKRLKNAREEDIGVRPAILID